MSFPMSDLGEIFLPNGFVLWEDGAFFQLSFNEEPVTTFSSFGATPDEKKEEIQQAAEDYLAELKQKGGG